MGISAASLRRTHCRRTRQAPLPADAPSFLPLSVLCLPPFLIPAFEPRCPACIQSDQVVLAQPGSAVAEGGEQANKAVEQLLRAEQKKFAKASDDARVRGHAALAAWGGLGWSGMF